MSRHASLALLAVLVIALAAAPFVMPQYGLVLGFGLFVAAGLALAWNLVGGIAGQFALGHALCVGVGACTVALATSAGGWPLPLALGTAAGISAVLAAVSAALFLRMRTAYFPVATMGLSLACMAWSVTSPTLRAAAGSVAAVSGALAGAFGGLVVLQNRWSNRCRRSARAGPSA